MAEGAISAVVREFERLMTSGGLTALSEEQLLDRFVSLRDESAFEAIVLRHGPMVRGVCRRLLRDANDVDDAFQATFLVLARKASTLRRRERLGNWLYGVSYRIASRVRSTAWRRNQKESKIEGVEELAVYRECVPDADDGPTLHEEIHRLPENYRVPVVLCYLEGLTHEEAAARLHWPVGTLKSRLTRARDLLRSRLGRRGVSLSEVQAWPAWRSCAPMPMPPGTALPQVLVESTVKAAALVAVGKSALASGLISTQALTLSEGAIHAMFLTKLKIAMATLAVASMITTGAGVYAYQTASAGSQTPAAVAASNPATKDPSGPSTTSNTPAEASSEPLAKLASQIEKEQTTDFDALLEKVKDWNDQSVIRLISWSTDVMATLSELRSDPASVHSAQVAHRDRMTRLMGRIQKVADMDRARLVRSVATEYKRIDKRIREGSVHPDGTTIPPGPQKPQPKRFCDLVSPASRIDQESGESPGGGRKGSHSPGSSRGWWRDGRTVRRRQSLVIPGSDEQAIRRVIAEYARKSETEDKSPANQRILKKLDLPILMSFPKETPLEDLLKYIKAASAGEKDSGIPIYVDPMGLQDAEKTMNSTIVFELEGIPLKTTLRLMLKQIGLAYCVKDGLLMISTPQGILDELRETENERLPAEGRTPQVINRGLQ